MKTSLLKSLCFLIGSRLMTHGARLLKWAVADHGFKHALGEVEESIVRVVGLWEGIKNEPIILRVGKACEAGDEQPVRGVALENYTGGAWHGKLILSGLWQWEFIGKPELEKQGANKVVVRDLAELIRRLTERCDAMGRAFHDLRMQQHPEGKASR